ncbi:MAG: zinc ABC transporter substrate-binding protein [Mariprofundaceae bacterium]|nr:zinc ABC transporter substrate-binding protein [Mariprofundaceae bacterium]
MLTAGRRPVWLLLSLFFLFSAPCQVRAEIITTLPPLAGLIGLLDEQAHVDCLLAAGADPHHTRLSPRQVEALRHARLLVRTSRDDGHWTRLEAATDTLDLWPDVSHAWLNPHLVKAVLPQLATAIQRLYPSRREAIAVTLRRAESKTNHWWEQWQKTLRSFRSDGVIMQHGAWQGMMDAAGVPVLAVLESRHHGREHGPHMLEHALETLRQHPQALLLGDMHHNNRALEWLAERTNRRIIYLDALGTCGMPWPALMRSNLQRLQDTTP